MDSSLDPANEGDPTDSTDSDEVILISLDDDDDDDTPPLPQDVLNHDGQHFPQVELDSDLELVESDEEVEEEITIIELSDTEIKDESEEEEEEDDEIVIKQEDIGNGCTELDPSQLGVIVTKTELPDDLLGEPVNNVFKCRFCPQKFKTKEKLILHIERHINNGAIRKCRFCEFYTTITQTLREHEWKHTNQKPYQCNRCDFSCRLKGDLARHQQRHSSLKRYQCNVCGHRTKTASNLSRHKERHKPDQPRKCSCTVCGAAFKRPSALKAHVQRRHSEAKPFFCKQCPFRCKSSWELRSHMARHSNDHPYKCTWPGCGKTYKTQSDCNKHMKRHSGVKDCVCNECGKKFFNTTMLRMHASAHSDVRNFECADCLKRFKTKRSLQCHILIHQAIKPFHCDVCYKTYASQNNLDNHKRVHGGGRPYQCPICMHGSREMEHLWVHIGSEHLHNFTFLCGLCRKPFGKSAQLQLHMQRCHKPDMKGHEEVLVYEPDYLDLDLKPEPTGAFEPSTFARYLGSETFKSLGGKLPESSAAGLMKQETTGSSTSGDNGVASSSSENQQAEEKLQLPPVVQLARFGGIPFCLVRMDSGFRLNCQKKGKKPQRWFMDVSQMTDEDRERHNAYLRKKQIGLLPQNRRGRPQAKSKFMASGTTSRGKTPASTGRGKRKFKRSRRRCDSDEDEDSDEDSDEEETVGGHPVRAKRVSSRPRKKTVMSKNLPVKTFVSSSSHREPAKKSVSSLSVKAGSSASCSSSHANGVSHSSGNKAADTKRNKHAVSKILVKKVVKSRAKSLKQSSPPKRDVRKQGQKGLEREQKKESCNSGTLAMKSLLPVSHYKTAVAALNSQCWAAAMLSSVDRGLFTAETMKAKQSTVTGRIGAEEGSGVDLREEFFVRCLQLKERVPRNDNAICAKSSAISKFSVGKEATISSTCDNTKHNLLNQSECRNEESTSLKETADSNLHGSQPNSCSDDSILQETSVCLSNMLGVLSEDSIPHTSKLLLPCAEDINDAYTWLEMGKCLPAVVDGICGGSSQYSCKHTVLTQSEKITSDSKLPDRNFDPCLSEPDKDGKMMAAEPLSSLENCLSMPWHSDDNEEETCPSDIPSKADPTTSVATTSKRLSENLSIDIENIPDESLISQPTQGSSHSQSVKSPEQSINTTGTTLRDISKKFPVIRLKRIDEIRPEKSCSTVDGKEGLLKNLCENKTDLGVEASLTSREGCAENSFEAVTEDHLVTDGQKHLIPKILNKTVSSVIPCSPSPAVIRPELMELHSCSSTMESFDAVRAQESTKCLHVMILDVCTNLLSAEKLHTFGVNKAVLDVCSSSGQLTSKHRPKQTPAKKMKESAAKKLLKTKSSLSKLTQGELLLRKNNAASCMKPANNMSESLVDRVNSENPGVGSLLLATAVSGMQKKLPARIRRPTLKIQEALASKNLGQKKKQIKPGVSEIPDQNEKQTKSSKQRGPKPKQAESDNVEESNSATKGGESELVPGLLVSSASANFAITQEFDEPSADNTFLVVGTLEYKVGVSNDHLDTDQHVMMQDSDVSDSGTASKMPGIEFMAETQSAEESVSTRATEVLRVSAVKPSLVEHESAKTPTMPSGSELVQAVSSKHNIKAEVEKVNKDEDGLTAELNDSQHSFEDISSAETESTASSSTTSSPRKSPRACKVRRPMTHPHSRVVMDNLKTLMENNSGAKLPTGVKNLRIFTPSHQRIVETQEAGQAKKLLSNSITAPRTASPELSRNEEEVGDSMVIKKVPVFSAKSAAATSTLPGEYNSEILISAEEEKASHVNEKETVAKVTDEQQPKANLLVSTQEQFRLTDQGPSDADTGLQQNAAAEDTSMEHSQDLVDKQLFSVATEIPAQMGEIPEMLTQLSTHTEVERCNHEEMALCDVNPSKDSGSADSARSTTPPHGSQVETVLFTVLPVKDSSSGSSEETAPDTAIPTKDLSPDVHEEIVISAADPARGTTPPVASQEKTVISPVSPLKSLIPDVKEETASVIVIPTKQSSPDNHEEVLIAAAINTARSTAPPDTHLKETVVSPVSPLKGSSPDVCEETAFATVIPTKHSSLDIHEEFVIAALDTARSTTPPDTDLEETLISPVSPLKDSSPDVCEETAFATVIPIKNSSLWALQQESLSEVTQNEAQETREEQVLGGSMGQEKETPDVAEECSHHIDRGADNRSPVSSEEQQNPIAENGALPTAKTSVPTPLSETELSPNKERRKSSLRKWKRKTLKRLKDTRKNSAGTKPGTPKTKTDSSCSRIKRKGRLKMWYKMNLAKACAARKKKSITTDPQLPQSSAAAENIIRKSVNSAFKIVKPPLGQSSNPSLKSIDSKAMKRKRFLYVETDTGVSPEPVPKKRGRRPRPKIIIDRSQANLCFEPPTEQLFTVTDQAATPLFSEGGLSSTINTEAASISEEVPSLVLIQTEPAGPSLTGMEVASGLPQPGEVRSLVVSEALLQPLRYSEISDSDLTDIKPVVSQLNDPALLDIKPLIEELKYLNQTDNSGQFGEPVPTCRIKVEEPSAVDAAVGELSVSQLDSETGQLQDDETSGPSSFQASSQITTRKQPGKPPRGRKKMKDRSFIVQGKFRLNESMWKNAERRKSERPRKLRLTGEQIKKAQESYFQDSGDDSDFDVDEDMISSESCNNHDADDNGNSSDIEFVTADYSNVDLAAQRRFLEDLRVDMFSYEENAASSIGSNELTQAFTDAGEVAVGSTSNSQLSIKTDILGNTPSNVQLETLKNVSPSVLAKLEPKTENILPNTTSDIEAMRAGVLLGDPATAVTTCKTECHHLDAECCNCLDEKPNIKDSKLCIMAQYNCGQGDHQGSTDTGIMPCLNSVVSNDLYSSVPQYSWGEFTAGVASAGNGLGASCSNIFSQNSSSVSTDGLHAPPQSVPSTSTFGQYMPSLPGFTTAGQYASPSINIGQYMSQNSAGASAEQFASANSLSVSSVDQYMSHSSPVVRMGQCMLQCSANTAVGQNLQHSSLHAAVGHFALQGSPQVPQSLPGTTGEQFTFQNSSGIAGRPNTTWNSPLAVATQSSPTNQVQVPIFTDLDVTGSPSLTIYVKTVDGQRVLLDDNQTDKLS